MTDRHPRTGETVEQCARRFLRIANSPGRTADREIALQATFKLMLQSASEAEREFYSLVHTWLSEG